MSFESIGKEKFDRFRPPHLGVESLMVWQTEWFANKVGTTIGTLALGKAGADWNYAICGCFYTPVLVKGVNCERL